MNQGPLPLRYSRSERGREEVQLQLRDGRQEKELHVVVEKVG